MTKGVWFSPRTFLLGIDYFKKSDFLARTLYIYIGPVGIVLSGKTGHLDDPQHAV